MGICVNQVLIATAVENLVKFPIVELDTEGLVLLKDLYRCFLGKNSLIAPVSKLCTISSLLPIFYI